MTFSNTEQRIHYDLLYQNKERVEVIESQYNEIMRMHKEHKMTYKQIGLEMGVSDATISRRVREYKKLKALEESNSK